jgi:hypothetical protein
MIELRINKLICCPKQFGYSESGPGAFSCGSRGRLKLLK